MAPWAGGMLTITDPQGLKESSSLNASSVKKTRKGDGGQAAISLTPGIRGTGSGSLLDSILYNLLRK